MLVLTTTPGDLTKRLDRAQPQTSDRHSWKSGQAAKPWPAKQRLRMKCLRIDWLQTTGAVFKRTVYVHVSYLQLQIVSLVEQMWPQPQLSHPAMTGKSRQCWEETARTTGQNFWGYRQFDMYPPLWIQGITFAPGCQLLRVHQLHCSLIQPSGPSPRASIQVYNSTPTNPDIALQYNRNISYDSYGYLYAMSSSTLGDSFRGQ